MRLTLPVPNWSYLLWRKLLETYKDRIKEVFNACLLLMWMMVGLLAATAGLLLPALGWLESGVFPERDLLWWLSDPRCYATNWVARGFEGMDACRLAYIDVTDMVGLDKIINWFLDLNLVTAWLLLSFFVFWLYGVLFE